MDFPERGRRQTGREGTLSTALPVTALHQSLHSSQPSQFSRSVVSDSATPWTAACQACLSITNSRSLPKLMSIASVMPTNHLILCHPLLPSSSIFPSQTKTSPFFESLLSFHSFKSYDCPLHGTRFCQVVSQPSSVKPVTLHTPLPPTPTHFSSTCCLQRLTWYLSHDCSV